MGRKADSIMTLNPFPVEGVFEADAYIQELEPVSRNKSSWQALIWNAMFANEAYL